MRAQDPADRNEFTPGDVHRVTRAGRVLRRTKLDELPQIWNVLMGDMAFVGPRPEVREWVSVYPRQWTVVHTVRPGLTDPISLFFWHEETMLAAAKAPDLLYKNVILPQKLRLYREYVSKRSMLGDALILFKTLCRIVQELGIGRNWRANADEGVVH
jgi:lipopolysaccharide/colanic/teichoic acid biosynthesis glycosyltransferase